MYGKCFVYVITDGRAVKIGVSSDVAARVSGLQSGNPKKLKIMSAVECRSRQIATEVEAGTHFWFDQFEGCGLVGEWFKVSPERAAEIVEICLRQIEVVGPRDGCGWREFWVICFDVPRRFQFTRLQRQCAKKIEELSVAA